MSANFDPKLIAAGNQILIEGECTGVQVTEPGSPFQPPLSRTNHVVDPTKPFRVSVEWEVRGSLVPLWLTALDDEWDVRMYVESQGPGPEQQVAQTNVPVASGLPATPNPAGDLTAKYSADLIVPPNTLRENVGGVSSGIYRPTICMFLNSALGPVGYDITGFHTASVIKAENPV